MKKSCYVIAVRFLEQTVAFFHGQLSRWFSKYYDKAEVVHLNVNMPKTGVCPISGKSLERLELLEFDKLKTQVCC